MWGQAFDVCKDQIVRFGGQTDPSLPWPEHGTGQENGSVESHLGGISKMSKDAIVMHCIVSYSVQTHSAHSAHVEHT